MLCLEIAVCVLHKIMSGNVLRRDRSHYMDHRIVLITLYFDYMYMYIPCSRGYCHSRVERTIRTFLRSMPLSFPVERVGSLVRLVTST